VGVVLGFSCLASPGISDLKRLSHGFFSWLAFTLSLVLLLGLVSLAPVVVTRRAAHEAQYWSSSRFLNPHDRHTSMTSLTSSGHIHMVSDVGHFDPTIIALVTRAQ
jgi:hypothetical protein